jgi:hypothetical protein
MKKLLVICLLVVMLVSLASVAWAQDGVSVSAGGAYFLKGGSAYVTMTADQKIWSWDKVEGTIKVGAIGTQVDNLDVIWGTGIRGTAGSLEGVLFVAPDYKAPGFAEENWAVAITGTIYKQAETATAFDGKEIMLSLKKIDLGYKNDCLGVHYTKAN